jgi:hypothetical protein
MGPITAATTIQVLSGGRVTDDDHHGKRRGEHGRPQPLRPGDPVMCQPGVDRQGEEQGGHLQRRHQHDRGPHQGDRLQAVVEHGARAACPPLGVAQRHTEQLEVADFLVGDLMR